MELFKGVLFFYKSGLNETFVQLLTDFSSINCSAIYRAYRELQNELSMHSKIVHKFSKYDLYFTCIAPYSLVIVSLIYFYKKNLVLKLKLV